MRRRTATPRDHQAPAAPTTSPPACARQRASRVQCTDIASGILSASCPPSGASPRLLIWSPRANNPLPVAVAAAMRNVGAHRVAGEKPDNQAETGCAKGKCNLLVYHGDRRSLSGLEEKRLPLTQNSSLSRRHCCGNAERGDLAPGSLRVAIPCWLAVTSGSTRNSRTAVTVRRAPGVGWCYLHHPAWFHASEKTLDVFGIAHQGRDRAIGWSDGRRLCDKRSI